MGTPDRIESSRSIYTHIMWVSPLLGCVLSVAACCVLNPACSVACPVLWMGPVLTFFSFSSCFRLWAVIHLDSSNDNQQYTSNDLFVLVFRRSPKEGGWGEPIVIESLLCLLPIFGFFDPSWFLSRCLLQFLGWTSRPIGISGAPTFIFIVHRHAALPHRPYQRARYYSRLV